MITKQRQPFGRLPGRISRIIPEGRALSENEWRTRHQGIVVLTWLHAFGLAAFGFYQGLGAAQSLIEGAVIACAALAATPKKFSRRFRSVATSLGLITSSAILVQFSGGYIEAHFHFFVMLAVISIYQDWIPYLVAVAFVALEHGLTGQFVPSAVYNHSDAVVHPWKWAVIHASFVLGESAALLTAWRISERAWANLDLVLNSTGEGIIGLDNEGIITFANPAAANMTGYSLEVLVGGPIDRILRNAHDTSPGREVDSLYLSHEANANDSFDKVIFRSDGVCLFVDSDSNPIRENGVVVGAVVTLKDVTARRKAEAERKRTLSLLGATLESTADGILVVDKNSKISLMNDKFYEMWRVPESLKKTIGETKDERGMLAFATNQLKDPEVFLKKVLELCNQPDAESFDILDLADGRTFERYSKPQRIGNESVGRVWSFRDITERRQASEALKNEVKTMEAFLYTISHDLKTPVVSMHGMASVLREECGGELNDKAKHYIERIIFNAGYMERLIKGLLALSRVGRKQPSGKRVEARTVIEEILTINKEDFQEKKIEVVLQPTFPHFILEHSELVQLFQNLITNAAKFMGNQAHPRIEIGGSTAENGVEFFVKDNGIGIDPAYHEKIFDLFHRLQDIEVEGTGVGLPIVKKIVDSNRGKVRLESQKGDGTTFFFWLPEITGPYGENIGEQQKVGGHAA